jgi:hypothetical protein
VRLSEICIFIITCFMVEIFEEMKMGREKKGE